MSISRTNSGKKRKRRRINNRRMRQRHLRRLAAALLGLVMVLGGVLLILYLVKGTPTELSAAYRLPVVRGTGENNSFAVQKAEDLSSVLVMSPENVENDRITLETEDGNALLFNLGTRTPLYARDIYERIYPASITKIMTAIVAIKYGTMDETVVMQESDFTLSIGAQVSGLKIGDSVTQEQLYKSMVIFSANDCAMALARSIAGSVEGFVELMNEEAAKLGMTGTHFVNPTGLHDSNHYTTTYDIYLMLNEAAKYTAFTDTAKSNFYELSARTSENRNRVIGLPSTDEFLTRAYKAPTGVTIVCGKTGSTGQAGNCLALVVQDPYGIPYIAIMMGAPDKETLYPDMIRILSTIAETG